MKMTKSNILELAQHLERRIDEAGYGDVILADFLAQHICGFLAERALQEAEQYRNLETWGFK